jgi:hypothetical protein
MVAPINGNLVLVPWNFVPVSVVREHPKPSSLRANDYGIISQFYLYKMPPSLQN